MIGYDIGSTCHSSRACENGQPQGNWSSQGDRLYSTPANPYGGRQNAHGFISHLGKSLVAMKCNV